MPDALGRFKRKTDEEQITWFWVIGPRGAVSTWISAATVSVLGRPVCSGIAYHRAFVPDDASDDYLHEPCQFLEGAMGWCDIGTSLGHEHLEHAFLAADEEHIYQALVDAYRRVMVGQEEGAWP